MSTKPDFQFFVDLQLVKGGAGGRRLVRGVISDDGMDVQGERVLQGGLDFGYFMQKGALKYEHGKTTPANTIGYPLKVIKKGHRTEIEGELFAPGKQKLADDVWVTAEAIEHWNQTHPPALRKTLGWSIEGKYGARTPSGIVKSAKVHNVVITPNPVNTRTFVEMMKSLQAGSEQSVSMTGAAALRGECLEGARKKKPKKRLNKGESTMGKKNLSPESSEALADALEEAGKSFGKGMNLLFATADGLRKSAAEGTDISLDDLQKSADEMASDESGAEEEVTEEAAGDEEPGEEEAEVEEEPETEEGTEKSVTGQYRALSGDVTRLAGVIEKAVTGLDTVASTAATKAVAQHLAPLTKALTEIRAKQLKMDKSISAMGREEAGFPLSGNERIQKGIVSDLQKSLANVGRDKIADWLLEKSLAGEVDPAIITAFERTGNLPESIAKSASADLCK